MNNSTFITGALMLASMSCTIIGNLLLKMGVNEQGISSSWPLSLLNFKTALGAMVFCFALLLYMMVLKTTPLNIAQSIFSTQFVLVIIAANIILGEPISLHSWIGITFIATGLLIIATASSN